MPRSARPPAVSSYVRFSAPESRMMADIIVDIFYDSDDGLLKVTWSRGISVLGGGPYHISYLRVEERSTAVRDALQELVHAGRDKKYDQYEDLVRETAKAGFKLYEALFFGASERDRNIATRARNWLEQHLRPTQDTITFRLPSRMHFPWGLIYDQPVKSDTDPGEFKKHFWCEKYSATVHYFTNRPEWEEKAWPSPPFGVLFGADQELWSTTYKKLELQEKDRLFGLLGHPAQPVFRIEDLSRQWHDQKNDIPHALLTFYCHASGDQLSIGGVTVSYNDFEEMFVSSENSPPTLVFLAGCNTAVGELHKGFFKATAAEGYCGFVGTEVKVPDIFTLRFVAHFLDRFFSTGESVATVLHSLRRQHWPLSLVFSVCCSSDLRLEPAAGAMAPRKGLNLSTESISSE
jgi:hypothetical protein